jgi:hypothetical protein
MNIDFTPKQLQSLTRLLERFVMEGNKHIQENFVNHQEAKADPYLVTAYIEDMAVAAHLYSVIRPGGNLYAEASRRVQGLFQPANPQPISRESDDGVDLLTALENNRSLITGPRSTERATGGLLNQVSEE